VKKETKLSWWKAGLFIILTLAGLAAVAITLWQNNHPAPKQPHFIGHNDPADPPLTTANGAFQKHCAGCHGNNAEGVRDFHTPPLAGLPRWYVERQLTKFTNGERGAHPDDQYGNVMRISVQGLDAKTVANAVDDLLKLKPATPTSPTPTPLTDGNLERGKELYRENCMACHRFNGNGEKVFGSAPIAAFPDWYLHAQILKFQQGVRGYSPKDADGKKMRLAVTSLQSPQDINDIIRCVCTLRNKSKQK